MKRISLISSLFALLALSASCGKEEAEVRPGTITVYGNGYCADMPTVFEENAVIMKDSTRLTGGIHSYFKDYQMLVSEKYSHNGGYIISDADALVFVIAALNSMPPSWKEVADSGNKDNPLKLTIDGNVVELRIYSTVAYAGKKVAIPTSKKAFCATPLAKKINYVEISK